MRQLRRHSKFFWLFTTFGLSRVLLISQSLRRHISCCGGRKCVKHTSEGLCHGDVVAIRVIRVTALLRIHHKPTIQAEINWNHAYSVTRSYIERVIGWWKKRYSSLHGEVRLDKENVPNYINASTLFWNAAKESSPPTGFHSWKDRDEFPEDDPNEDWGCFNTV
uniref:Transposase n=1 Tax=Ditylenchus dipsaci TaxID=166011 RepID=A0A915DQS6_9BILA